MRHFVSTQQAKMIKPKWSFLSRRKDDKRYIISMVSHGAVQVEFTLRRLPWWLDLESPLEKALLFECVFGIKCPRSAKRPHRNIRERINWGSYYFNYSENER